MSIANAYANKSAQKVIKIVFVIFDLAFVTCKVLEIWTLKLKWLNSEFPNYILYYGSQCIDRSCYVN